MPARRVRVVGASVQEIRQDTGFVILAGEHEFHAGALVVATGGLSIPKIGATSFGYELARQFGIRVKPCRPALVPLLFHAEDRSAYGELAGVSTEARVSCNSQEFTEKMLFTHRGLSGPAILQISSYWQEGQAIVINLAPHQDWVTPLMTSSTRRDLSSAKQALRGVLPQRLADRWLEKHPPKNWTNHSLAELERSSHRWTIAPAGTEGYEKAEVTAGGVDTDELSAKTMECRRVPSLHFIGEVVDVTGHLGGSISSGRGVGILRWAGCLTAIFNQPRENYINEAFQRFVVSKHMVKSPQRFAERVPHSRARKRHEAAFDGGAFEGRGSHRVGPDAAAQKAAGPRLPVDGD
jgi:predicted Rossmann fold flavoprotein